MADRGGQGSRRPRLAGWVGTACLVGSLLGGASPLRAATAEQAVPATAPLVASAWFWSQQLSGASGPGGQPATVQDPTVPSGDLVVAGPEENGQPQKETYLSFDVSVIPPGSQILSFVITLPVDPAGTNLTPSGVAAPIVVCEPKTSWSPGEAQPFSQKPADACATGAPKVTTRDGGRSYSVDVASVAQSWVGPDGVNLGVAITDNPSNTSTAYQVVFGPGSTLTRLSASVTYIPPAPSSTGGPPSTAGSAPGPAGGSGPSSAGVGGALVAPVTPATQGAAVPTAPAIASAPAVPATSVPTQSGSTIRRAVQPSGAGSSPPAGFWVAGALLLLMVAAAWLILQAPAVGGSGGPQRRRGVARLLDSQVKSTAAARPIAGDV